MSQKEKTAPNPTSKAETFNNKKNDKHELELDELVGKLSIEGASQVSQKLSKEEKQAHQFEADSRSIFVGNITPNVTPEQIEEHFQECGLIKRITLLYDRNTGTPKGYGYIAVSYTHLDVYKRQVPHSNEVIVFALRMGLLVGTLGFSKGVDGSLLAFISPASVLGDGNSSDVFLLEGLSGILGTSSDDIVQSVKIIILLNNQ